VNPKLTQKQKDIHTSCLVKLYRLKDKFRRAWEAYRSVAVLRSLHVVEEQIERIEERLFGKLEGE